ncbi:MAG: glycosyltransferase family 4 protein [Lachnospiraceae bacterium]|nr:glycosyltransferase family 4 protein [Lachnospiraceae bacterium]
MSSRLFILTNDPVPYGTANANYIRNFSKAVAYEGWKVIVIGMSLAEGKPDLYRGYDSNDTYGIEYWNINDSKIGKKKYLKAYLGIGEKYSKYLKTKFKISKEDYILVYSDEVGTDMAALNIREVPSLNKAYCEVEWLQRNREKYKYIDIRHMLWDFGFKYRAKMFKKAIPISKNLELFCIRNHCKTLIVPALIDANIDNTPSVTDDGLVHFIYPGSATNKDSFDCMVTAFANLNPDELKKIRFHLTGKMTKEVLYTVVNNRSYVDAIENNLVFHGWLGYEELLDLYADADYLLLARANKTVTISNFPSKVPEMMNYGIVPVCSKVGDYTDSYLLDGYDSIHFKDDIVEECLAAIRKAIEMKESKRLLEMKFAARKTAVEKFDYRKWGKRIISFFEEQG